MKNQLFFSLTYDFIKSSYLFDRIIVNSNDNELLSKSVQLGLEIYERPESLCEDISSIRSVFLDMLQNGIVEPDDYLWLFYIPLLYKNFTDFKLAFDLVESQKPHSISTFIKAKTHPLNCWRITDNNKLLKFVDNDVYNRQDLPQAYENYHYVFAILAENILTANANLLHENTYPMILDDKTSSQLVEIDDVSDFLNWKKTHPESYGLWYANLSEHEHCLLNDVLKPS